jgi:hypothetical protein
MTKLNPTIKCIVQTDWWQKCESWGVYGEGATPKNPHACRPQGLPKNMKATRVSTKTQQAHNQIVNFT